MSKSGYCEVPDDYEDKPMTNTVSILEQETHIAWMRDEKHAIVYTSDTTQMTKFDKLCKNNPDMYTLIEDTGRGKTYRISDKTLVSFRSKKREMSEEAKKAASQRFKDMWASKS